MLRGILRLLRQGMHVLYLRHAALMRFAIALGDDDMLPHPGLREGPIDMGFGEAALAHGAADQLGTRKRDLGGAGKQERPAGLRV